MFVDLPDRARGITDHHGTGRYVTGDHRSGADHRPLAYRDARQYHCSAAN
jgi:hypothetical protein